jgi:xylan 1,4-beta-xylosidase
MRISVNHGFERRIGLFPAGFDDDGVLFCNQNFGDYPTVVPDRRFDPWTEAFAGWMLLSHQKDVTASSAKRGHPPVLAVNEDVRYWWVADRTAAGEWLRAASPKARSSRSTPTTWQPPSITARPRADETA